MTREEAIAILQEEIDGNLELTLSEWRERDEQKLFPAIRIAIKALQADAVSRDVYDKRTQADEKIIDSYRQEFQKAISAETAQGEWKHTITWQPYCSNCEYVFGEDEEFSPFWKYCPMCGARMKGGAEE